MNENESQNWFTKWRLNYYYKKNNFIYFNMFGVKRFNHIRTKKERKNEFCSVREMNDNQK